MTLNRVFSHDVTVAMFLYQNKGTAALILYQANPLGIELCFYANTLFHQNKTISLAMSQIQSKPLSASSLVY